MNWTFPRRPDKTRALTTTAHSTPLDSARRKAWVRLLPLLFLCYVIAYIDRTNVSLAKLTMTRDLPGFDNRVIGIGAGIFFIGYFLLEIPGTLIVERWSARKWICRIMVTWGFMAALTAAVKTPGQFYAVRFFLGLAEAGFFPGVIVFMTHWFPARDRGKALAIFMTGSPIAQMISPKLSNILLKIGTTETINGQIINHPHVLGLAGWQWVYIVWGVPAVLLGIWVFFGLTDRPGQARWLNDEEKHALQTELDREKQSLGLANKLGAFQALAHPKVIFLALAYFCIITGHYGVEFFMPSILKAWYSLSFDSLTTLMLLPPLLGLASQLFVGWNSDRTGERRLHVVIPIFVGALALAATPFTQGQLWLTIICFMFAFIGIKAFLPIFWTLPNLFLTEVAAASSIGLINSIGNLGGFSGPYIIGSLETGSGSFDKGIYVMSAAMLASAAILFFLGLGKAPREAPQK